MAVTHAQTTVSTTAATLGRVTSNEALTVQNNSAVTVYLGGPGVTTSAYGYALAPPANEEISSILQCRLFRDSANALDTYTGSVALLSVDAHVEFDRIGSRDEYVQ